MGFMSVLSFAHELVRSRVKPGDTAVDATAGNGNDTLFLSRLVGPKGLVYAFDIQEQALASTSAKLADNGAEAASCKLLLASHADMLGCIPQSLHEHCAAVMFNFGYLPGEGADQSVITLTDSSLAALEASLELLRVGGVVTAVLYPGHPGGLEEAEAVEAWARGLPPSRAQALVYRFVNQRNASPYVIAVEKRS